MESERDDLTGACRFRKTIFGRLVLQIEVIEVRYRPQMQGFHSPGDWRYSKPKWRDARASEMERLILNGVVR